MRIKTEDWGSSNIQEVSGYIADQLEDRDYGGATESAQATASNSAKGLGTLCNILAEKGLLTADDIVEIAASYSNVTEFVE